MFRSFLVFVKNSYRLVGACCGCTKAYNGGCLIFVYNFRTFLFIAEKWLAILIIK